MKRHIIYTLLFLVPTLVFAKGGSGVYYIKGIAYTKNKTPLKNETFSVKLGNKITEYKTDNKGQFEIEIRWVSACPSGLNDKEYENENKRLNPEFIFIQFNDSEIKIKNEWKKYAKLFPKNKKEITKHENLQFL